LREVGLNLVFYLWELLYKDLLEEITEAGHVLSSVVAQLGVEETWQRQMLDGAKRKIYLAKVAQCGAIDPEKYLGKGTFFIH
jgi:hypothetical protein